MFKPILIIFLIIGTFTKSWTLQEINPYENLFKNLLKEPPLNAAEIKSKSFEHIEQKWLKQNLNHFASQNDAVANETWLMRYFVNKEHYEPGGPIFIFVGGEWQISPHYLAGGHFYDMAQQHGAMMFYTEHRFYGQSWPREDSSLDNLKYLSIFQSLQDLKYFIDYQRASDKHLQNAKVILAGGSYSGSMVSWFMKLYPQTAQAAWASSAPLLAKLDLYEYMELATVSIKRKGGTKCAQNLHEAFDDLAKAFQTEKASMILKRLNVCSNFNQTNTMDIAALFNGLGNYFAALVQSQSSSIPQFCYSFEMLDSNPLQALLKYFAILFSSERHSEMEYCLDLSYKGMQQIFMNIYDTQSASRCWFYQTCNEFGWYTITTPSPTHTQSASQSAGSTFEANTTLTGIYGGQVPFEYFQQLCHDVFINPVNNGQTTAETNSTASGTPAAAANNNNTTPSFSLQQMQMNVERINQIFGGLQQQDGQQVWWQPQQQHRPHQNVIYTHGLLDPWRAVGLQHGANVLLLADYSHVQDFGSINLKDTVELNVAKLKIAAFINRALRSN